MADLIAGVEAGGTKFVCAVGGSPEQVREELRFPTTTPAETIARVLEFFKTQNRGTDRLAALGIGCFGPLDLNERSPTYGYITTTPKAGWTHTDFLGPIRRELAVPLRFDTDVNAAAAGEWRLGAAKGLDNFVYLTFGTGVGGGGMIRGKPMRGLSHPEMGHMKLPRDPDQSGFRGVCPYHEDCFEGLASGPAMEKRWGQKAETLAPEHPAWEVEADIIAKGLMNLICVLSPERIILGGSVMLQTQLFPMIRRKVKTLLNGYALPQAVLDNLDGYIAPAALGDKAGVLGAMELARDALDRADVKGRRPA